MAIELILKRPGKTEPEAYPVEEQDGEFRVQGCPGLMATYTTREHLHAGIAEFVRLLPGSGERKAELREGKATTRCTAPWADIPPPMPPTAKERAFLERKGLRKAGDR